MNIILIFIKGYKVTSIEKNANTYDVLTSDNLRINTKTIIVSTGTKWKKLNVIGEEEYIGKGVHYCSTCDDPFIKIKKL